MSGLLIYPGHFDGFGFCDHPAPAPQGERRSVREHLDPRGLALKVTTEALAEALDKTLPIPVRWAMRYGSPSIESVLKALAETGIKTLRYVPLYPHWAMSTTETSVVEATRARGAGPPLRT